MSYQAVKWVLEGGGTTPVIDSNGVEKQEPIGVHIEGVRRTVTAQAQRLVLIDLAERCGDEEPWIAWPGVDAISRRTRLSERTVQRALRALVDGGVLAAGAHQTGGHSSQTTRYTLKGWGTATGANSGTDTDETPTGANSGGEPSTGANSGARGANSGARSAAVGTRTIKNHQEPAAAAGIDLDMFAAVVAERVEQIRATKPVTNEPGLVATLRREEGVRITASIEAHPNWTPAEHAADLWLSPPTAPGSPRQPKPLCSECKGLGQVLDPDRRNDTLLCPSCGGARYVEQGAA